MYPNFGSAIWILTTPFGYWCGAPLLIGQIYSLLSSSAARGMMVQGFPRKDPQKLRLASIFIYLKVPVVETKKKT